MPIHSQTRLFLRPLACAFTTGAWVVLLAVAPIANAQMTAPAMPQAPPQAPAQLNGELLYSTHCIACHTTQMHWREKKLATDWNTLVAQIQRWQANTGLGWKEEEVTSVARYLNDSFYQYPRQVGQISLISR